MAGRIEFAIADTTSAERHPTRLAIEPVAEHRVFFFTRAGPPADGRPRNTSLETLLVFPLATLARAAPHRHAHRQVHADREGRTRDRRPDARA